VRLRRLAILALRGANTHVAVFCLPSVSSFDQVLLNWPSSASATIVSTGLMTGLLRAFYVDGAAVFSSLSLRGNESAAYSLTFTLTGTDLFGTGVDSMSLEQSVTVQACELGERFDALTLACACAEGYGLVVADSTCRVCGLDEGVCARICGGFVRVATDLRSFVSPRSGAAEWRILHILPRAEHARQHQHMRVHGRLLWHVGRHNWRVHGGARRSGMLTQVTRGRLPN
jgi:hypothetical protein